MPYKLNAITGNLDLVTAAETGSDLTNYMQCYVQFTAPASPVEGRTIWVKSDTDEMKIYYGGSWQLLHSLTPAVAEFLLLETSDRILLETGDKIVLE